MMINNEAMAGLGLTGNSNSNSHPSAVPEETSEAEISVAETSFDDAGETTEAEASSFEGGETTTEGGKTTATTELQYFGSDHAVDGRNPNNGGLDGAQQQPPAAENRRLESLTIGRVVARRRQSRKSINLGDLITGAGPAANRRESVNSMMSSLTCSEFGDSFFTDEDSRWLLDDLLEDLTEDNDEVDVGDQEPILPIRRDSLSEERLMSSRHHAFYDLGMPRTADYDSNDDAACPSCHPSKVGHDLPPKTACPPMKPGRRESIAKTARPPMKPGRRESIASIQLLRQTMFPDRNSFAKDKPLMLPNRNDSLSTLSGHFSSLEAESGHFSLGGDSSAAGTTGEETTGSSSIDPSLDLGLKRTKGKRALFA